VLRHEIKVLLLFVGITASWSSLIRPVTQVASEVYVNTARSLGCTCVVVFAYLVHQLLIKTLTSRLHSSTFWEQLHSTARWGGGSSNPQIIEPNPLTGLH